MLTLLEVLIFHAVTLALLTWRTAIVTATSYCEVGRTASGSYTQRGTVAVDRARFPFGTKFKIPGYGYGRARDTGGAIIGNHIDVWLYPCKRAIDWGVKRLRIRYRAQ